MARSVALYGDTGTGKTTQIGELIKDEFKRTRRKSMLYTADLGGYDSISSLERLGVLGVVPFDLGVDDPWQWVMKASGGEGLPGDTGLVAYDSATSMSEALLSNCAKLAADNQDIGGRPAPKIIIGKRGDNPIKLGTNVDTHYGVVQGFMLDAIWRSTYLTRKDITVVWTFGLLRGEGTDQTPILGPKLAGKALTPQVPKWFEYTFRLVSLPVPGAPTRHLLYIQEQPEANGLTMSFGNARYPLGTGTSLPAVIEPANVVEAFNLIEGGQAEADARNREELGL